MTYKMLWSLQLSGDPLSTILMLVIRQNPGRVETIDILRPNARHSAVMILTILRLLS